MHLGMKGFIFPLCVILLASCAEDEASCRDRLLSDFEGARSFGDQQARAAPLFSEEAVDWQQYALTASESALTVLSLYHDDDRNVCDYVSAGPRLERK